MSAELELLDQLDGHDMPYSVMERHVFGGDRGRALSSISIMQSQGLIEMLLENVPVAAWMLEAWRRDPADPSVDAHLSRCVLSLTDAGARWDYDGRHPQR